MKPSTIQATQIMNAYSKAGKSYAGERAESHLKRLTELYTIYKEEEMRPNALSYTTVRFFR